MILYMLYNIILIDSRGDGETKPEIKTLDLTEGEVKEIELMIEEFTAARYPYIYPQMYICKIEDEKKEDFIDWYEERKDEVKRWKNRMEERKELLRKFRESRDEDGRKANIKF